jgi:Prolyl oligopeptidase family
MSRIAFALLAIIVCSQFAPADGPKDNLPDNVRPVPPKGNAIKPEDASELRAGLDELGKRIADLKDQPLLPDVEIYHKAVRYGLEHNELYVVTDPKTMKVGRNDVPVAKAHIKTGLKRAQELKDGKPSWTTATGLVVRGYRSKIDGSAQPYGLVIPKEYDFAGQAKHRLDYWWHGRYENNLELSFLAERERSAGQFTPAGAIVVHPFGRFSNANKFAGEIDSLEILDHLKKHYRIDESRIVARGFSMGGAACWQYAVHYPTLFCAAAPGAGFSETREFLRDFQNETVKPTWYEKKLWRMYDATESAQNIFNIPTVAYSGEIDSQKQAADVMAREMKKVGLELTHIIGPKTGHSYEKNAKEEVIRRIDALAAKGKDPMPKEIRFTTHTLRYNECAWIRINELAKHWEPATVVGKVEDGQFAVTTKGVTALAIVVPFRREPFPMDVSIDGTVFKNILKPDDATKTYRASFGQLGQKWISAELISPSSPLLKYPGLQGPIDDAFMDSFLMVKPTGTPFNPALGEWTKKEMTHAVDHWRKQFRGDAPVKADKDVTDDDIRKNNLILWGDPQSNAILAKLAGKLPVSWESKVVVEENKKWTAVRMQLGDVNYDGNSHVPVMIFPNPLNSKKYVVLNSGFTYREYAYLNNARQVPMLPDYAIVDTATPPDSRFPGKVVRAGFFDERWQLQVNDGR